MTPDAAQIRTRSSLSRFCKFISLVQASAKVCEFSNFFLVKIFRTTFHKIWLKASHAESDMIMHDSILNFRDAEIKLELIFSTIVVICGTDSVK